MKKKNNLKLILLALIGILLALGCISWSLGFWRQAAKREAPPKAKVILNLDPLKLTTYIDKEFTVNVLVQSEKELIGADLYLSYDPQILEISKIKSGGFFADAQELSRNIDAANGRAFYALIGLTPKTGKGILASFSFKGKVGNKEVLIFIDKETQVAIKEEGEVALILPDPGKYTILELTK